MLLIFSALVGIHIYFKIYKFANWCYSPCIYVGGLDMYFYVWWWSMKRAEHVELLIQEIRGSCVWRQNVRNIEMFLLLFLAQQPPVGQGLLIHEFPRSHTTTHHSRQDSSGRVISSSQRPLPDSTQHSQQTFTPPSVIRTHNLSRRAAAEPRLRPRGHWDQRRNGINPNKMVRNKSSERRNISWRDLYNGYQFVTVI